MGEKILQSGRHDQGFPKGAVVPTQARDSNDRDKSAFSQEEERGASWKGAGAQKPRKPADAPTPKHTT